MHFKTQAALFAALFITAAAPHISYAADERPNIVVVMSDDMGWSDIGAYGGEIRTPNLDKLAENGLRFTQFYNTARCCPTRASLLTGLHPHQAGMGHMLEDRGETGYRGDLNTSCVTIAEVLRDVGYRTYALGKWHITRFQRPNSPNHNWPLQRGFDKYYGIIWGVSSQYDPAVCRGNTWYTCENDPEYKPEKYYFIDAMSDNAVSFLKQHKEESDDKPFFMYVAYTAAHWPMHAFEEDIAKYDGQYDAGYEQARKNRIEKLKKLGLIDPRWTPAPTAKTWPEEKAQREWEIRCMQTYAAMVDSMDEGIGKITAELKKQGKLDNTVFLYLQDNGGCAEDVGRVHPMEPPKDIRPLTKDELPASGHPRQTRDGRPVRGGHLVMPGPPDTYVAYGEGWANVSNTPFREYKHWVHEGGISTPLIVHWPKGIAAERNNTLVNDPSHLIDIMATCVDLGKAKYPAEFKGHQIVPMQGISLKPALEGRKLERGQPLFWEHESNRAVRDGKWKLVAKEDQPWELYDMEADRTEMNNLADKHPELVKKMSAQWDAWAAKSDILPLGTWRKEPRQPDLKPKAYRFDLKPGDVLSREDGPVIGDKGLTITAEIVSPGKGVVAAQGGRKHGYALYFAEGKAHFDVRRNGKLKTLVSREEQKESPHTFTAVIGSDGEAHLLINGTEAAKPAKLGKIPVTPGDGLSIGKDSGDPVGEYGAVDNAFTGKIDSVVIELEKAGSVAGK